MKNILKTCIAIVVVACSLGLAGCKTDGCSDCTVNH